MDRMAWNEEVGKLMFQFRAALGWLDVSQAGVISTDVHFALNVIDQTKTKNKSH